MVGVENIGDFLFSTMVMCLLASVVYYQIFKNVVVSFFISLIKYCICAAYFLIWSNYSPIILLDDQTYFENSLKIYANADESIIKLFSVDSIAYMGMLAGGIHFGYYIFIFISFALFGSFYYSAVLLNIFLTSITAYLLYKTLKLAQVNIKFIYFFVVLFSLHWDVITWSSFINLKDILVLHLAVWALYCLMEISVKGKYLLPLIKLCFIALALYFLRFYLVYFLVVTGFIFFALSQLFKMNLPWLNYLTRPALIIAMPLMFYLVFVRVFSSNLENLGGATNVVVGFLRFLLTPFPTRIEENYSFLFLSSVLHWLTLPFLIHGAYLFVRRYFVKLMPLLILALLLCVFYGSFDELQGPRHRVLILYFIVLLQALSMFDVMKVLIQTKK